MSELEPHSGSGPPDANVSSKQSRPSDQEDDLEQAVPPSLASLERTYAERKQTEEEQRRVLEEERKRNHEKKMKELERSLEDSLRQQTNVTRELEPMEEKKENLELLIAEARRKRQEFEIKTTETLRMLREEEEERVEEIRKMRRKEEALLEALLLELEKTEKKLNFLEEKARVVRGRADEAEKRRVEQEARTALAIQQAEEAKKLLKTTQKSKEAERWQLQDGANSEYQAFHVRDLAPTKIKVDPEQVNDAYRDAAKAYLKTVSFKILANDDLGVFKGFCRGLFAASKNFPEEMIPPDGVIEEVDTAFTALKSFVSQVEDLVLQNICLPIEQFTQHVSPHRLLPLISVSTDFRELLLSRMAEFATDYEKRNAELVKQQEKTMKDMIATMGADFEREALDTIGSKYFEPAPLMDLLNPIAERLTANLKSSFNFKADVWMKRYVELLHQEIQDRRWKIQEKNEGERKRTELEIQALVEESIRNYEVEFNQRSKHDRSHTGNNLVERLQRIHDIVKKEALVELEKTFQQRYSACPGLRASAAKEVGRRVDAIFAEESKKVPLPAVISVAAPAEVRVAKCRTVNPNRVFNELPSFAVAIHMGLHHTKVGLFKPGTSDFRLLAEVHNCLYYRNNRILLAFSDEEKVGLGPPDLDLGGIIVDEPVDKNYSMVIDGQELKLRKEHLLSWFLLLLKCKIELELKMKLPKCVAVVPQFLNTSQRRSIYDAATIAGFIDVKFIDDTAAIALEYMMRVGEKDRDVIVASALESDVIDVAAFKLKNRAVRWTGVSGTHFLQGDNGKGLMSKMVGIWWLRPESDDIIAKVFSHNELDIGKGRLENDLKLFAGDYGLHASIVARLGNAKNFAIVGELNALRGGAYLAELLYGTRQSPLFEAWSRLEISHYMGQSFDSFKEEIMFPLVKEKKRCSNHSTGTPMSVKEVANAKRNNILTARKEAHRCGMEAMKVSVVIAEAVKRKEIKDANTAQALSQQLPEYFAALKQTSLTLEGAKQMHDQLIEIWQDHVQAPRSRTR